MEKYVDDDYSSMSTITDGTHIEFLKFPHTTAGMII